ncbi:COP9 signalosome complex subunit 8 [Medicago truncatula]|uniref:COP9 signalosome complex subunit 8 n=1 Tax=Medicago truncatula TaxID=3880 RepID=UPI0019684871|nr:COP9 signalosome complex subunit 8-like [Medicago truncatula]
MLFPELYTKEIFQLLVSAYSTISVEDAALFLGMSEDGATSCRNHGLEIYVFLRRAVAEFEANYVLQQGWTVDNASRMLTVKKQPVASVQKLDPRKLQQLTEYVFHLEH